MTGPRQPKTSATGKAAGANRIILPFEDNRLVADLLGPHDSHLTMIEQKLGVGLGIALGMCRGRAGREWPKAHGANLARQAGFAHPALIVLGADCD